MLLLLAAPAFAALAEAGFHAVAPDQRGYGETDRPDDVKRYTQLDLVGDVIGLLDALGEEQAVVVGHDFGALIARTTALLRPDRVRGGWAQRALSTTRSNQRPGRRVRAAR